MNFRVILTFTYLFYSLTVLGQDIQYSQYYSNFLYLNPAFAGGGANTRAMIGARNQWPGLQSSYSSYSTAFDHYIENIKSGIGIIALSDRIGGQNITSSMFGLSYSYRLKLSEQIEVSNGIQASYNTYLLNYNKFVFNDQLSQNGLVSDISSDHRGVTKVSHGDIGAGTLLFTDKIWIGVSVFHLPSIFNNTTDGLITKSPTKFSFHGGYKIPLTPYDPFADRMGSWKEISITPTFQYKSQGKFDQLDIGTYFTYQPFLFGIWYRGMPFLKNNYSLFNNESLVGLVGLNLNGWSFGYSYDFNLSQLDRKRGAHELTVIYEFWMGKKKKKRMPRVQIQPSKRRIPCPKH